MSYRFVQQNNSLELFSTKELGSQAKIIKYFLDNSLDIEKWFTILVSLNFLHFITSSIAGSFLTAELSDWRLQLMDSS
jgi:hypothetical protein